MGLLKLLRRARNWVAGAIAWFAPPNTLRRSLLRNLYHCLFFWRRRDLPPRPIGLQPLHDPYDREALNRFFARFGIAFPQRFNSTVNEITAARRLLELLVANPEHRAQFPRVLREGPTGSFGQWLGTDAARSCGITSDAASRFLACLAARPGLRVVHCFDQDQRVRRLFELGLTPADSPEFVYWLLVHRKAIGVTEDEALWFLFESFEDPGAALMETFRRQPRWQQQVPHGLTRFGWEELRRWVASTYSISADWLRTARRPDTLRPLEEWHWIIGSQSAGGERASLLDDVRATRPLEAVAWCAQVEVDRRGRRGGVNLLAHLRFPSGLQVAALNTSAALEQAGWVVSRRDVPTGSKTDLLGRESDLGLHPYPATIVQVDPGPLEEAYSRSGLALRTDIYRIGYWYWELEDVPPTWNRYTRLLNELWAPTRFIGDAFRRSLALPIVDMPAGMRMPPVVELPRSRFGLPADRYLFLYVFDMCSTIERKNPLAVVEAFRRAFSPRDPVALAIKVSRGYYDPAGLRALTDACTRNGVFLIDAMLSHEELFGLMNCCHAYVSLHRSEGYGLTMAEAMALGKPVIATGYSGNLDFMTPANSLLVDYSKVPLRASVHVYRQGCRWAEPSVDHAAELMRWVVSHPAEAQRLGERAARDVRAKLSLEAAGQRMAARLDELTHGCAVRAAG